MGDPERTVVKSGGEGALQVEGHAVTLVNPRFEPAGEVVVGEEVTLVVDLDGPFEEGASVDFVVAGFDSKTTKPLKEHHKGSAVVEGKTAKLAWTPSIADDALTPRIAFLAKLSTAKTVASKLVPLLPTPKVELDDGRGGEAPTAVGVGQEVKIRVNPEAMPAGFFRWQVSGGGRVLVKHEKPEETSRAILRGQLASEAEEDVELKVVFERKASGKTYEVVHKLSVFEYALEICLTGPTVSDDEESPLSIEPAKGGAPLKKDDTLAERDLRILLRDDHGLATADKGLLGSSCCRSKPADYKEKGWLEEARPQVPFRISFARKLRGGKACAIEEGELKLQIQLGDPPQDAKKQSNATVQTFFQQLDASLGHPKPGRGHNGVKNAGGERDVKQTFWIHRRFWKYDGSDQEAATPLAQQTTEEAKEKNSILVELPASTTESGAHRSDLHLLYRGTRLAGDSVRFAAATGGQAVKSGIWTFWKRIRADAMVTVESKLPAGKTAWDHKAGLDKTVLAYRECFIDLELPTDEQRYTVSEADWKSTVKSALSDKGVATKDEEYLFGEATFPRHDFGHDIQKHLDDYEAAKTAMEEIETKKGAKFTQWKRLQIELKALHKHLKKNPEDKAKKKEFDEKLKEYKTLHSEFGEDYLAEKKKAKDADKAADKAKAEAGAAAREHRTEVIDALIQKGSGGNYKGFAIYLGPQLHWTLSSLNGFAMGDNKLAFFDKGQGAVNICGTLTHELGHALYLRHSVTKAHKKAGKSVEFNGLKVGRCLSNDLYRDCLDHDPGFAIKCVMSYTRDRGGEQLFCGFCQLILRFWNRDGMLKLGVFRQLLAKRAAGLQVASAAYVKDKAELKPAPKQMKAGDKAKLLVLSKDAGKSMALNLTDLVRWESQDETVVKVNGAELTAVKAGTATIKITLGSLKSGLSVTVK